jgi:3-phenylpropionate/trans-cinnamate dioxygenase ferredoxin subunit
MAKYVVGMVEEIPPGARKVLEVAGRSIGVFNIGGDFYALRNSCPHQGGPLCQGQLTGFVMARVPSEYSYTRQGEILRCPWHGWEFDVKTGQSWFDPQQTRVRAYTVTVESVAVEQAAEEGDQNASAAPQGLQPGPYTAETYEVTVEERAEEQVVVVEIP